VGSIQFTIGHQHKYFPSILGHLEIPQVNKHAYIPNNIRLNNMNCYLWTREIHTVRKMKIIVYTKRIINKSLGRPKNLLHLKVWSAIRQGICRCAICHNTYKSSKIIRPLGPFQQKFIPIKSMTKWTPLQVLFIRCRLFESLNIIGRRHCVHTITAIP
jgi:hypothetical protein